MALSRTLVTIALICSFAVLVFAQFDEGGCDGLGGIVDKCGVCGGNNDCLKEKHQYKEDLEVDYFDARGVIGCDGEVNSGLEYDDCGECGGSNVCLSCDGLGGQYDDCGLCNGDGTTCGGCDGKGSIEDDCGVCGGDNSDCMCIKYHGFKTDVMEYMLIQYTIDQTLWKIQHVLDTLILIMEDLEEYSGPADLGVLIHYLNEFCSDCLDSYSYSLDKFTFEVKQSIGLESNEQSFNTTM